MAIADIQLVILLIVNDCIGADLLAYKLLG
jgi:hypothetical protein